MARVMITDVEGVEHDFSARQSVRSAFYDPHCSEPRYQISDHRQSYRVTMQEFDCAEAEEKAAILEATGVKPEPEEWIATGRYAGVEIGELPNCTAENYVRVVGGAARASAEIFGSDDDIFGAASK
jgi:hypothetical protein